jgi:hypothetical protein
MSRKRQRLAKRRAEAKQSDPSPNGTQHTQEAAWNNLKLQRSLLLEAEMDRRAGARCASGEAAERAEVKSAKETEVETETEVLDDDQAEPVSLMLVNH